MIRLLILVSLGTVISASAIPSEIANYPRNLAWLFGLDVKTTAQPKQERTVCNTEECKLIAQVIKDSMDETVDPCDDFYEYACGNWPKNNPVPENMDSWDLWHMVQKNIENQIKGLLDVEIKPDDVLAVKLAKKWYRICNDTDRIEASGLEPLLSTVSRYGGWPMIMEPDEWDEHLYKWQKVDDHYARLSTLNAFFDLRVTRFNWESDDKIVLFDTPHLGSHAYKLGGKVPTDEGDLSDENENSDESREPGSELSKEDKDEDEDENEDKDEEEDEDESDDEGEAEIKERKVSKRKSNRGVKKVEKKSNARTGKKSRKHKATSKRVSEKKTKRRIKRRATKVKVHSNKQHKGKKIIKTRVSHHATKMRVKTPRSNKMTVNTEDESAERSTSEKRDENNDETENKNDDEHDGDESTDENESRNNEGSSDDDEKNSKEDDDDDDKNDEDDDDDDSDEDDEEERKKMIEKYEDYVFKVAMAFAEARDADISEEKLKKDVKDMVDFYVKLIGLSYRYSGYENMTLDGLQELYDSFEPQTPNGKVNWASKVKKLFLEAEMEIDGSLEITVESVDYLKGLRKLLDETPSETIVNYVHWHFISMILMTSTQKMRDLHDSWNGRHRNSTREEICLEQVEMTDIVGYEYVRKYFSDEIGKTAMDMIDDIQKEVEYQIKESTWIDEDTKDFILDKLVNMEKLVGYPDWYRNNTIVRRYFQGLTIGPSFYENVLSYIRYYKWKSLQRLYQAEDDVWFIDPLTLNAFFMPTENTITITAADFQSPFFAFHRPQSINFGIIGFVMAHEVNHGFDNDGHLYDKNGKVMEWLSAMAAAYNKRAECFVDQFNNYSVVKTDNFTIENYGNQTAGENIADTMGLQSVYRAYRRRERECGKPDAALPGLEKLDNDQLFFLSFANLWCESVDPETVAMSAMFDEHSTGRLRVIGSVSNSVDFAKAFKCPAGSPMNPEKKCNIWQ